MLNPYPYQKAQVDQVSQNFARGIRRQIVQLPTGGGKTIEFSYMTKRYLQAFNKQVIIVVHRDELLKQTRKTLYNHFNILSEKVTKDNKHPNLSMPVQVCMVETIHNRLKKRPNYFPNPGLLIFDECHIGNHKKVYQYFEKAFISGFSATPISATKKDPLKNYFDEIVVGPQIEELIKFGSLTQNETYSIKGVKRDDILKKRGKFDVADMYSKYSKSRHIQNTLVAYRDYCEGRKTMVFNVNVEHSLKVNQAFLDAGLPSKHLDGTTTERKQILDWFHNTPNTILNNIGVLTTGFDEPSVRNVIVNKSTLSLPLWLQMTGRGSRIYEGKDYFRIIDMGGNALKFNDWRAPRDWYHKFHNPDKVNEDPGLAPVKSCENCEALIFASTRICQYCGHIHERVIEYDSIAPEFEMLVGRINVDSITERSNKLNHKEWAPFFEILRQTISVLRNRLGDTVLDEEKTSLAFDEFEKKVIEWRASIGKPYAKAHKKFAKKMFREKIMGINQIRA